MRTKLTKIENNLLSLKQLKRKLNFSKRKFAVPNKLKINCFDNLVFLFKIRKKEFFN